MNSHYELFVPFRVLLSLRNLSLARLKFDRWFYMKP